MIPFRAEHLIGFSNRDTAVREEIRLAIWKEQAGPAYTALAGDTILGCAGVILLHRGVGAIWMTLSEAIAAYTIWFHRTCRRVLADVMRAYSLHRLEANALAENERNQRWLEAMGFRSEGGLAHAYTPDRKDIIRYELTADVWTSRGNR